jgi:hypothetical protein
MGALFRKTRKPVQDLRVIESVAGLGLGFENKRINPFRDIIRVRVRVSPMGQWMLIAPCNSIVAQSKPSIVQEHF